ncbi:MAG TPA: cache domain-containing protein [Geobacteraceae bacterium]
MARRFPIRAKLTFGALAPLFVAMFCCSLAGLYLISTKVASQAQEKVRTDLNSAREVLRSESARLGELVELTAGTTFTATAIVTGDRRDMAALLASLQRKKRLDILTLVDRTGRVLYREHNPAAVGDSLAGNHFVKWALNGEQVSGTAILTPAELATERADLAQQATIDLVPTPHARQLQATTERAGMVLAAAGPVRDACGRIIGAL